MTNSPFTKINKDLSLSEKIEQQIFEAISKRYRGNIVVSVLGNYPTCNYKYYKDGYKKLFHSFLRLNK